MLVRKGFVWRRESSNEESPGINLTPRPRICFNCRVPWRGGARRLAVAVRVARAVVVNDRKATPIMQYSAEQNEYGVFIAYWK